VVTAGAGYVKISGMIESRWDKNNSNNHLNPGSFAPESNMAKDSLLWLAGVLVNFLLAMFIYSMVLFAYGDEYLQIPMWNMGIMCDSRALNTGFQNGDKIISVDSQKYEDFGKSLAILFWINAKLFRVTVMANR